MAYLAISISPISIHVLREEDDSLYSLRYRHRKISIHVLREEDDSDGVDNVKDDLLFQSTSSARRTTSPEYLKSLP